MYTIKSVKMAYYFDDLPYNKPLNPQFRQETKFLLVNEWSELEHCLKMKSELSHRLQFRYTFGVRYVNKKDGFIACSILQ